MEKEFVNYEIALELKELGFNEPCIATRFSVGAWQIDSIEGELNFKNSEPGEYSILSPTFSQAFRFFREKYKYDITIPPSGDSNGNTIGYYYEIIFQSWDEGFESDSYDTYEEAELECLKKLIEIVKQK